MDILSSRKGILFSHVEQKKTTLQRHGDEKISKHKQIKWIMFKLHRLPVINRLDPDSALRVKSSTKTLPVGVTTWKGKKQNNKKHEQHK